MYFMASYFIFSVRFRGMMNQPGPAQPLEGSMQSMAPQSEFKVRFKLFHIFCQISRHDEATRSSSTIRGLYAVYGPAI